MILLSAKSLSQGVHKGVQIIVGWRGGRCWWPEVFHSEAGSAIRLAPAWMQPCASVDETEDDDRGIFFWGHSAASSWIQPSEFPQGTNDD